MKLHFREARTDDNTALCTFFNKVAMRSSVQLHRSNFIAAESLLSIASKTLILTNDSGEIFGTGSCTVRHVDSVGRVGYLSSLRLDPSIRHGRYLLNGYAHMRNICASLSCTAYITTILEENATFSKLFNTPRKNMPRYQLINPYHTYALPVRRTTTSYTISAQTMETTYGYKYVLTIRDTTNAPIGIVTLLDVSKVKNITLHKPLSNIPFSTSILNLFLRFCNYRPLPYVHQRIPLVYMNRPVFFTEDPGTQKHIIRATQNYCYKLGKYCCILSGCTETDTQRNLIKSISFHTIRSNLYQVQWNTNERQLHSIYMDVVFL